MESQREIQGLACRCKLVRRPRGRSDHHQASGYADMGMQRALKTYVANCTNEFKPCPDRAFGIMLLCFRVSEIDEQAIAQDSCHHAAEPCGNISARAVNGAHQFALVLRIERGR